MGIKFLVLKNHEDLFSRFFYNLERREINYQKGSFQMSINKLYNKIGK